MTRWLARLLRRGHTDGVPFKPRPDLWCKLGWHLWVISWEGRTTDTRPTEDGWGVVYSVSFDTSLPPDSCRCTVCDTKGDALRAARIWQRADW